MAKQSLVKKETNGVEALLSSNAMKERINTVLGNRANVFASSLISLTKSNKQLQSAEPKTIVASAMKAAALDLPIDQNLGFAYIVPYGKEAQFQMGYKGFVQLALRTGEYKAINCIDIREGELKKVDLLRDEYEIDFIQNGEERNQKPIVGYAGYFKLMNGFEKVVYWSKEELEAHGKQYSQTYKKWGTGLWKDNFDGMAKKTVIKNMLSKWGMLSIDIQRSKLAEAIEADQAVIGEDLTPTSYPDNEIIDVEPVEAPKVEAPKEEPEMETPFDNAPF